MESLTLHETREAKKSFLKKLPIWDDIDKKVGVFLKHMEFDVKTYSENLQRISEIIDTFPRRFSDGRRKSLACKQHINNDIVKLYHKKKSGEVDLEEVLGSDDPLTLRRAQTLTPASSSSIDLLRLKPSHGDLVFAKVNTTGPWVKCKIKSVYHKSVNGRPMTNFKLVMLDGSRTITAGKYEVARIQNHGDQLRASKRVVAGLDEASVLPGIIAQDPHPQATKNRYMVFLDNGICQYFGPNQVYPIFYQSSVPWRDLQHLGRRDKYLEAELNLYFKDYPKKLLFVAAVGKKIDIIKNGVSVSAVITKKDCDAITIAYKDGSEESIYQGCPRMAKSRAQTSLLLRNSISVDTLYPKLLGNMRRYHEAGSLALGEDYFRFIENFQSSVTICGSNTARKSTGARSEPPRLKVKLDETTVPDDRDLLPRLADLMNQRPKHNCSPDCLVKPGVKTEADVQDIVAEFRDTCDIKVPLLLGWKRQMVLAKIKKGIGKQFIYEAPCGRIFKQWSQIRSYIVATGSKFDVDYFTFEKEIILNRKLGERTAYHFEENIAVNKAGEILENKYISLINPISEERLPLDFEYRSDTFPHPMLQAKGFSFNHDFKSGCDCEDDCSTRASCACHRLTEQAAGTTAHNRGQVDDKCHYKGKRLHQQVSTGIFECNSFCRCSSKCPNRVVQNGIRIRMQVRKTIDKGWGVFVLDDVPKGSFICTYSAELLDDADQYGDSDMYYADLDYITIVEHQKLELLEDERKDEGFEMDEDEEEEVRNKPKSKSVKRRMIQEEEEGSDVESVPSQDDDYMPRTERYPKRNKPPAKKDDKRAGGAAASVQQYRKIHSILNENQDYTLDARMQGNIGRFFNHCCDPNSMVQNVFIETHDLRFPVVAFFTKKDLKADDEINWHYNYKIDSIAGRQISCNCGASNCAGRIL